MLSHYCLGACQAVEGNSVNDIKKHSDGVLFVFFSNDKHLEREGNYYDVLLDLKKQYPKENVDFIIVHSSKNTNLVEHFKVKQYPTLVVLNRGTYVTKIEGVQSKDAIRKQVLNALGK
ncbi:thioredoxin family protein [Bacillus tianshenii]|nr:thioredoxin family protein [Bacillus tianshenii]